LIIQEITLQLKFGVFLSGFIALGGCLLNNENGLSMELPTTNESPFSMNHLTELPKENQEEKSSEYLATYSKRDKWWDGHRADTDAIAKIYTSTEIFKGKGIRMGACTEVLKFGHITNPQTGEVRITLREAHFCKDRVCPVCQKRRGVLWRKRFLDKMPELQKEFPTMRWIFLTLTVKNCEIKELRPKIQNMNKCWRNFVRRKDIKKILLGHIRATEVTRANDGKAHPHFHCMLMVPNDFFKKKYIKQSEWAKMWKECLGVDYTPIVDVRAIKNTKIDCELLNTTIADELYQGVLETIKYSTKSKDLLIDEAWLLEFTNQVKNLRFIDTGGALKNVFKIEKETDKDLALADTGGQADDGTRIVFGWERKEKKYKRKRDFDV